MAVINVGEVENTFCAMAGFMKCKSVINLNNIFKGKIRNVCLKSALFCDQNKISNDSKEHLFKKKFKKSDIINNIIDSIVEKTDNFIVTSKPYGIGKQKPSKIQEHYIPQTYDDFFLEDILPDIADKLGYKYFCPVKIPERFASGVMILATNEEGSKIVTEGLKIAKSKHFLTNSYLVITVGHPKYEKLETKFAIGNKILNNKKYLTIFDKWSVKSLKLKSVKVIKWKHEVLSQSDLVSLLRIDISSSHHNCLRLFLATKCFSPVLGDQIYSNRILSLFGVPLLLSPEHSLKTPEEFNPELLKHLQIQQNELKIVPAHVHLKSVLLTIKKKDYKFEVPLPESFMWTCKQLNLKF